MHSYFGCEENVISYIKNLFGIQILGNILWAVKMTALKRIKLKELDKH